MNQLQLAAKAIRALRKQIEFLGYQLAAERGAVSEAQLDEIAEDYLELPTKYDLDVLLQDVATLALLVPDVVDSELIEYVFNCDLLDAVKVSRMPRPLGNPEHPMQPIILDPKGVPRFKKNQIVDMLLKASQFDMSLKTSQIDLNNIATRVQLGEFPQEDYDQLMQLIGYSVSGAGFLNKETLDEADRQAEMLLARKRALP